MKTALAALVLVARLAAAQQCEYPIQDLRACAGRTPRSGYTPSVNGCGPEGSSLPLPQGSAKASFLEPCNEHDRCYGTCNSDKSTCDSNFLTATRESCFAAYPRSDPDAWDARAVCLSRSRAYANAVKSLGQSAYDEAQKLACECCPPQYKGTLTFTTGTSAQQYSGTATVLWTQFDSADGVRRYLPSGTVEFDVTSQNCDSKHVSLALHTSGANAPNEVLRVYSATNVAFSRQYDFGLAGDGSFTLDCGSPRMPVTFPGSVFTVLVGLCTGPGDRPTFTSEDVLQGGPWSCSGQAVQSAQWRFTRP
jgi:hypothetical protein